MTTVDQIKEKIAHPLLKIEPFDGPRGGHWYRALSKVVGEYIAAYPSVTGQLDIIGGGKTHGLMWWAKRLALAELLKLLEEEHRIKGHTLEEFTPDMVNMILEKKDIPVLWIDQCFKMAIKKDKEKLKEAGNVGTRVHLAIDGWIMGAPPEVMDEDVKIAYNSFMDFVFKEDIKFVQGDTPVMSLKYKYGGRLDAIAVIKGELVLLDWKTGNAIRDDAACQTAAYNMAMEETLGIKAKRAIVCRFDKETEGFFEHREVDLRGAEKAWLHAHKLHNAFKEKLLWRDNGKNEDKKLKSDVPTKPTRARKA